MVKSIPRQQFDLANPASYSLLMAIDQPVIMLSKPGTVIAVNDKSRTELGLAGVKIKNLRFTTLVAKSHYRVNLSPENFSLKHGAHLRVQSKNQENIAIINFKCIEIQKNKGVITGYLLLGTVTKHKTLNLTKVNNQIGGLCGQFDAIPCGVFIKDLKGKVIDCNTTMAQILGADSPAELMNFDSYKLAIKGQNAVQRNDLTVIKSKTTHLFEEEVTLSNGKKRCYQTIKAPIFNKKNQVVGIIGTCTDITNKKNNERAMKKKIKQSKLESIKSYNYLDRIIASIPCNVWWTNKNNVVLGANNQVVRQFVGSGIKSREELIGMTYAEVGRRMNQSRVLNKFYEDDMEVVRTGIAKVNVPEPPFVGTDGKKVYYITSRTPLLDENGIIAGVIGTSWDITALVMTEHKLKSAQKKIEASSRAKDEFLATVSHELRTPLNGILGMADILSRETLEEKQKGYLTDLSKSGEILLSLIDDLLDISKMDLHEIKIHHGKLNLEESIQEAINHLASQIAQKPLKMTLSYSSKLPKVIIGDTQRIKQILFNIIGNAIKFTEKGQITVKVSPKKTTNNQKLLELTIKDTGLGIPPDKLTVIFDRFTLVRSNATKHIPGTGLGLSIAKSLVELMGGKIHVSSELGSGSTFTIQLPYEPYQEPRKNRVDPHNNYSAKILIVDDDISSGQDILIALQHYQTQLISSEGALKILNNANENAPDFDIIILNTKTVENVIAKITKMLNDKFRHYQPLLVLCNSAAETKVDGFNYTTEKTILLTHPFTKTQLTTLVKQAWQQALSTKKSIQQYFSVMTPHVLLVEDNLINQKIALHLLAEAKCTVDVCPNGRTALTLFSKNNYDIVLLDIGLPDIDGTVVSESIRKLKQKGDAVPIIAMTAYASEKDKQRCLNAGMNDVITKPVNLKTLQAIMARWLTETCNFSH
jgi:PAS domain S-box-containing protein